MAVMYISRSNKKLIYGAEWAGGTSSSWTRTDSASSLSEPSPALNNGSGSSPFDNIYPWSELKRVTDSAAGTLVAIPKFYYKWTRTSAKMKLQISAFPYDGFFTSPAHADRGDGKGERDLVYVGAYHCANSTYKSTTGVAPQTNITRATGRSKLRSLGTGIWQWDWAMLWTIRMLYLVEYASWDVQSKIGVGCGNSYTGGDPPENNGLTDGMSYHTGTTQASRSTPGHVRYRYIEDLWANCEDMYDGIYFNGTSVYAIKNPSNFYDTANGTLVGTRVDVSGTINGYTNPTVAGYEWCLYPSSVYAESGEPIGYTMDRFALSSGAVYSATGGMYTYARTHQTLGLFREDCKYAATTTSKTVGTRLMKLP